MKETYKSRVYTDRPAYEELKITMDSINRHGYDLIAVTQDHRGFYTVFFRRRACG